MISAIIVAALAGCSPLAPRPDRSQFFILTPLAGRPDPSLTTGSANTNSQLAIGVGPIDFPGYLRTRQMVTLAAPNQLDLSPEKRWAEPLDKNFARVLTENLARLLNTQRIEKYPWPRNAAIDFQIAVDVQNFETTTDGQSQLSAQWIIKDGPTGKDLYASQTLASTPVAAGDAGESAALSADLATLSTDIASRITALNQHRLSAIEE
ncbi:MAG TPA: PqiC family protein [Candidatus Binataceae bacterium]|nr:PqiC family protein [Candidatus Binataceae bacterium]